jgi:FkbM family methyltransferase
MLSFIKRKLEKRRLKRTFREYGYEIKSFQLQEVGRVDYAQWLHPFEGPKEITDAQIAFYRRLASPGSLIIDVGAHTGDTTVPMGLASGPEGLVLGLEPNPYVFKILEKNASLNPGKMKLVPLPFAATPADGTFTFHYSDASFCNGGYLSQLEGQASDHNYELEVTGKDFDRYLRTHYADWLPRLELLKVDAEGFDKDILENLSGIIAEYRPSIMAECYNKLTGAERKELYRAIARHGYTVYLNDTDYLREGFVAEADWIELTAETMDRQRHFEIVAIPD